MSYKKEDIIFYTSTTTGNTYMFVPQINGKYTECFYLPGSQVWHVNRDSMPSDYMYGNTYNSVPYLKFMDGYNNSRVPIPTFVKDTILKITSEIISPIQSKTIYYFTSPGGLTHQFPTRELAQAEWEKISKFNSLKELANAHGLGIHELETIVEKYNKIQNNQ